MAYESIVSELWNKYQYWNDSQKLQLYGNNPPPNQKYGNVWKHAWETRDEGVYIISPDRVSLETNDGRHYTLVKKYHPQAWNIFRAVYLNAFESKQFRFEIPVENELIEMSDGNVWSFTVSQFPDSDVGVDCYTHYSNSFTQENLEDILDSVAVYSKTFYQVTQQFGSDMSRRIYCPEFRWKNDTGFYWRRPDEETYDETYSFSIRHGLASLKVTLSSGKPNSIIKKSETTDQASNTLDVQSVTASAKEKWKL
jgi:hypothetical protein